MGGLLGSRGKGEVFSLGIVCKVVVNIVAIGSSTIMDISRKNQQILNFRRV